MDIIEEINSNVLLANFMGWDYKEADEYTSAKDKVYFTPNHYHTVYQDAGVFGDEYGKEWVHVEEFLIEELKFHESYNWIMEVVEKIEGLKDTDEWPFYRVAIAQCVVTIINRNTRAKIVYIVDDTKLQAIYQACVEFVKWYNK